MIPESHRNTDTPFWVYLPAGIIQKMGVPRGRPNGVTTAVWMKISLTNLISLGTMGKNNEEEVIFERTEYRRILSKTELEKIKSVFIAILWEIKSDMDTRK